MAYKSYRKKSYSYRGRRKYRRGRNIFWRRGRNKVYRMAKKALFLLNPEFKELDLTASGAVNNAHNFVLLNASTQGDTKSTRTGNSIKMVSLFIQFKCSLNASATQTTLKLMLVQDRQANGAAPTSAALFDTTSNILSPLNTDNAYRFKVLWSKYVMLSSSSLQEKVLRVYKKMVMHTRYSGNVGDITDITSNSIYLVMVSDEATNSPTVQYFSRIRFLDN